MSDLVQDGVTGYLLDPDDDQGFVSAVERLLQPEARKIMGRAALARASVMLKPGSVLDRFLDRVVNLASGR
jgi:glycosyltransferase involved in cell wall biosynthesis